MNQRNLAMVGESGVMVVEYRGSGLGADDWRASWLSAGWAQVNVIPKSSEIRGKVSEG
jgi:hypothetical protein